MSQLSFTISSMQSRVGGDSVDGSLADEEQRVHAGMERLGQMLRQCREQAGLSSDDICARIQSLSKDMLDAIENGRRPASVTTLHEVATLVEMTPEELLHGIYPWGDECTTDCTACCPA